MNLKEKGWFQKYTQFRERTPFKTLESTNKKSKVVDDLNFEQDIYATLQPTGMLYGFTMAGPDPLTVIPGSKYFDMADKVKINYLESLLFILLKMQKYHGFQTANYETSVRHAINHIFFFYFKVFGANPDDAGLVVPDQVDKHKIKELNLSFERLISTRFATGQGAFNINADYFNCFVFIELHYCMQSYIQVLNGQASDIDTTKLQNDYEQLVVLLLRFLIAAAHSSDSIEKQEVKLFEYYLKSAKLSPGAAAAMRVEFETGLRLSDFRIPFASWILRRYFLELSLLVILSDKFVSPSEENFLKELILRLTLQEDDLNESYVALNTFMLLHEKEMEYLNDRPSFLFRSKKLTEKATLVMIKNKDRLLNEIDESKELYSLLMKSRETKLTKEEKEKVKEQLLDILKSIPTLIAITLPGAFITLPLLLKILPKSMFPSSFRE